MSGIEIKEVSAKDIPAKKSRASSEFYSNLIEKVDNSSTGSIEIDLSSSERKAKSIYWGMSSYLKKNELRDNYQVVLRETDNKVYIKKI